MKRRSSLSLAGLLLSLLCWPNGELLAQESVDLLPDVTVDIDFLGDARIDITYYPGRRLLRFTAATPNIGAGTLEIRGGAVVGADRQEVSQRIYRSDGTYWERAAGTVAYHSTHAHVHFDDWAAYRLRQRLPDGTPGPTVVDGTKTSFCLMDTQWYAGASTRAANAFYTSCGRSVQGISPGWSDVYDRELEGQWIDITAVADGRYWLEVEVDPNDAILETEAGESNNVVRIPIFIGTPPAASPDRFEPNDSMAEVRAREEGALDSPNLGSVQGRVVLDELSAEDDWDYYRFYLPSQALPGAYVRMESEYFGSDVDLFLLDDREGMLDFSVNLGSRERVSLANRPAGYYIVGTLRRDYDNPLYRLIIDTDANAVPEIEMLAPDGEVWVERAYETLGVRWQTTDPDGDAVSVSLSIDADTTRDKTTIALGGYQNLMGSSGEAQVNTAALELGTWHVFAEATDGRGASEAWSPGTFVLYLKGDLDGDGDLDRADYRLFKKYEQRCHGRRHVPTVEGWEYIADMDRDGRVDRDDRELLADLIFNHHDHSTHTH